MSEQNPDLAADAPTGPEDKGQILADGSAESPEVHKSAPKSLEELLADAEARVLEQKDAWLRALADAENARKRAQADIAGAHKFAVERFVDSLIPVMDSLEAALAAPEPGVTVDSATLRNGVELTLKQLQTAFEKAVVAQINPAPGDKFDPHHHQAMTAVESDAEPNTVVSVMQKGFRLHDRVIRPALVMVSKARTKGAPPA